MKKALGGEDEGVRFWFLLLPRQTGTGWPTSPGRVVPGVSWRSLGFDLPQTWHDGRAGVRAWGFVGKTLYILGTGMSLLPRGSESTFPSSHLQGIGL